MKAPKLIDYALRLGVGAVYRRLGYLLEVYRLAPANDLARLRNALTATYVPLDPMLPKEGPHVRRWRLAAQPCCSGTRGADSDEGGR